MKKALIIVDMQNAFFANRALKEKKKALVGACNQLVSEARSHGCPIFTLRTMHERTRATWTLNMLDDDAGYLFRGDHDAEYVSGLDHHGTVEIIKTRDSGFWRTSLLSQLRKQGIDTVVLCGVSTHTCVAATASDAYNANLHVELATDAIASHDPRFHDDSLDLLHQEYRMKRFRAKNVVWA